MYEVKQETLINAYKPFDVVTNEEGDVGFVSEVSVNDCQDHPKHQISYHITWLVGRSYNAWWDHEKLTLHSNLMIKIAECMCHPMGHNSKHVETLFKNIK